MQLRAARPRSRRSKNSRKVAPTSSTDSSSSSSGDDVSDFFPFNPIVTEGGIRTSNFACPTPHGGGYGTSSGTSVKESEDFDGDSSEDRTMVHKTRKKLNSRRHNTMSSDSGISSTRGSQRSSVSDRYRPSSVITTTSEVTSQKSARDAARPTARDPTGCSDVDGDFSPTGATAGPSALNSPSALFSLPTAAGGSPNPHKRVRHHHRPQESPQSRRRRWLKTASVLRKSGLLDITVKTADLLRKNQQLQTGIEKLQKETNDFINSVLSNPENRHILENIQSHAQLYEVVVPGSQTLMSKLTEPDPTAPFSYQLMKSTEERSVCSEFLATP